MAGPFYTPHCHQCDHKRGTNSQCDECRRYSDTQEDKGREPGQVSGGDGVWFPVGEGTYGEYFKRQGFVQMKPRRERGSS